MVAFTRGTLRPHREFVLILSLFISARLMLLLAWPADDITVYGDYRYYFDLAALSEQGYLPFIHYWSEHAPLFPFLNLAIYQLSGGAFKNHALLLSLALLTFEAGVLTLLYLLARDQYGERTALRMSWVYTALFIPTFIWLTTYEAITAFFILLALWALRRNRPTLTGLAIGLGTMTKFLPVVVLATVWREKGWRTTATVGVVMAVVIAAVLLPLGVASPQFTLASLQAPAHKSSWQTVWALIDGNTSTGNLGPIADHFDPARATQSLHNPAWLPGWLTLLPFAAVGVWALTRPRGDPATDTPIFTALAITLLFLWSKGWSPQWQVFFIPLLLLALPVRRAVMYALTLGFVNFLEWPVILSRGLTQLLPLTIVARTLILGLVGIELYRRLVRLSSGR